MFEQSVLPKTTTRRPYAFIAVTTAELIAVGIAVSLPLFFIPALAPPKLPVALRFARAVHLVKAELPKTTPVSKRVLVPPRVFYAPAQIPTQIPKIEDLAAPEAPSVGFSPSSGSDLGVPRAVDSKGIAGPPPPPPEAQQPTAKSHAPLHVSSGVQEAKLINKVIPVYPRLAIQTRQFGRVRLIATVGKDGRVTQIQVISGPAFLVPAAVEAVKQWLYKPTLLNGQPVEVIAPIDINFTLNQ